MRRIILVAGIIFFTLQITNMATGQQTFNPKTKLLGFGIGPAVNYYSGYKTGFSPAILLQYDQGIWDMGPGCLSLGGQFGFSYLDYKYKGDFTAGGIKNEYLYKYVWMNYVIAIRGAYHYNWGKDNLDTYGGLAAGSRLITFKSNYYHNYPQTGFDPSATYAYAGIFVGASWFFTPKLAVNGELGYNVAYLRAGLVYKLGK